MIREKLASLAFALVASAGALPLYAESGWNQLNMTRGVTHISREIYGLHMKIFWICVVIGVIVFAGALSRDMALCIFELFSTRFTLSL